MYARNRVQAYRQSESAAVHPVKLIHMIYERVLTHLAYAEEAVVANDPLRRGENLSKAIALISELNAAVNPKDESEAAAFLRGLYGAIMVELPKVAINNDAEILRQAARYIAELKKVWEETAMQESGVLAEKKAAMQPSQEAKAKMTPVSVSI
ncbi:flagellar export chaperone FliS [Desulfurivibrio alkaliphilus]|uniref:Flagellar secretion chaperone FliS n=1 Tax=Desulfurivibrio alkaliphilus (strain DSM 19089 / UNIQEM U267 / AHT2) TaxID=589865 RepID=D6Z6P2_DESAT|nr:flagellar export chaperone FliS [Desulfurivibrio alkaliphilus]ADH85001.1 flagellar protein FliS [Desulfurivibrio alkaliphilus AHT 2]